MYAAFAPLAIVALLAAGQTSGETRVFSFSQTCGVPEMSETAAVIGVVTDKPEISLDVEKKTLVLTGTTGQVAIGGWLFSELAEAAELPSTTQQGQSPLVKEYRVSGNDAIHVSYLADVRSVQDLTEAVTLIRSTGDIQRLMTSDSRKAVIARGTPDELALTDWLLGKFGSVSRQSPAESLNMDEYPAAVKADPAFPQAGFVRVYDLAPVTTVSDLQEIITTARALADMRQLYIYSTGMAVAARGTANQFALVDWLFRDFDAAASQRASGQPGADKAIHEYRLRENGDIARVFYMNSRTPQQIKETANRIRTVTQIRRLCTYVALRAIAMRGVPQDISVAEQIIRESTR